MTDHPAGPGHGAPETDGAGSHDAGRRGSAAATIGRACGGLTVAAVALWASSAAVWLRAGGRAPTALTGAQVSAVPAAVAALALAGIAALVATGGVARRAVGLLLALAGVAAGADAARALLGGEPGTGTTGVITSAPLLAVAGGALLLVVGLFVLVREPRLARFGARYGAPRDRAVDLDPDRAAWQDLDAGRDPTVDVPADRGDDPGDSAGNRAV